MFNPQIGIQLYTLRDHIKTAEDFDSTLAKLEALGVSVVQISAIGDIPAETQSEILKKHGMSVCVTHKSFEKMCDELDTLIAEHKTIGCDALGLGGAPEKYRGTEENVRKFIEKTKEIGKKLKENGMSFNYHNHSFEFEPFENTTVNMMDLLIEETESETFCFIPDVAWIHHGKKEPPEVLERMKGRVKVLHFKDYVLDENGKVKFVSLGKGLVDLKACYEAACRLEIPYIVYEQDCDWTDDDPFKSVEESWAELKALSEG